MRGVKRCAGTICALKMVIRGRGAAEQGPCGFWAVQPDCQPRKVCQGTNTKFRHSDGNAHCNMVLSAIPPAEAKHMRDQDTANTVRFWSDPKELHGGHQHQFDKLFESMAVSTLGP
jgi:hypothetical protein